MRSIVQYTAFRPGERAERHRRHPLGDAVIVQASGEVAADNKQLADRVLARGHRVKIAHLGYARSRSERQKNGQRIGNEMNVLSVNKTCRVDVGSL